ncbi:MAG: PLP-dependent aminotransferase family protein [Mogibacterium sp.]|nr:PLP-dependent aminotransferase family protein [Mogibacterium sp.]
MDYAFSEKVSTLKPSAIRELFKLMVGKGAVVSLSGGNPSKDSFPVKEIQEVSARILKDDWIGALQYSVSEGYTPLRDLMRGYVKEHFGVGTEDDDIVITSGAQQANDMVAKIFCNEGDVVLLDSISFIGSISAFKANNLRPVGVDSDDKGMDPVKLEEAILANPKAKLIYLIPNFHNPTGFTMPYERRKEIYEVAKKYKIMILEDNPYGQLRFGGEDVPSIKTLDTEGIVCYSGSFSKVVAPGLRVGYLVANKEIIFRATLLHQFTDVHPASLPQMIVYEFYKNYDTDAHIKDVQKLYGDKARFMCEQLREKLPKEVTFIEPQGGMFVWITDSTGKIDIGEYVQRLINEYKVAVVSGDVFMSEGGLSHSVRLNFTVPSVEQIEVGVAAVADLFKKMYAEME